MTWILLTNDDGVDSPALSPLATALEALAEVRVVAPTAQRSWTGKAISRYGRVSVEKTERAGRVVHAVGGTPADCVQLAVYSLFSSPPALVVSGINLGLNVTLGFFMSSGTAGAAVEARLCGVPAAAFSTGVTGDDRGWRERVEGPGGEAIWADAAALCGEISEDLRRSGLPAGADLLNVNFLVGAGPNTERVVTSIAPVSYGELFRREDGAEGGGPEAGESFRHDFRGRFEGAESLGPDTDLGALRAGCVSVTPVALTPALELDPAERRRLSAPQRTKAEADSNR